MCTCDVKFGGRARVLKSLVVTLSLLSASLCSGQQIFSSHPSDRVDCRLDVGCVSQADRPWMRWCRGTASTLSSVCWPQKMVSSEECKEAAVGLHGQCWCLQSSQDCSVCCDEVGGDARL